MTVPQPPHWRGLWSRVAVAAVIGLAVGIGVWLIGAAGGAHPRPALCIAVAVAGFVLVQVVTGSMAEVSPSLIRPEPAPLAARGQFRELRTLERRLGAGAADLSRFDRNVRPALLELMADRLRHKHGIDLRRDPDKARALLGDELWELTSAMPDATERQVSGPSKPQLTRWISGIERL
ncbi:MAG TPA: hypothetical protein VGH11_14610 [Jatrophihabitans sp.]|jgi:hypothetical protein